MKGITFFRKNLVDLKFNWSVFKHNLEMYIHLHCIMYWSWPEKQSLRWYIQIYIYMYISRPRRTGFAVMSFTARFSTKRNFIPLAFLLNGENYIKRRIIIMLGFLFPHDFHKCVSRAEWGGWLSIHFYQDSGSLYAACDNKK